MKLRFVTFAIALLLGGCATFSSLPLEARAISRAAVSSPRVYVDKPRLKISAGVYSIEGFVQRNLTRQSTTGSYLVVTLFDVAGDKLKEERLNITPRELPFRIGRAARSGSYSLILGALPSGTARIEVRAHDTGPAVGG
jgi:hypothetical protein